MRFGVRGAAPLTLALAWLATAVPVQAAVFTVTTTNDAGSGSLRQAILDNNAQTGPNVIEIDLAPGANVIMPVGQFLPPLKGPVVVRVKGRPSSAASPAVVLDGSRLVKPRTPDDCPGTTSTYNTTTNQWENSRVMGTGPNVRGYYGAGLSVHDSGNVEISGLEIRNFCTGVAVIRSHRVYLHDLRITESHGTAGVIFTGDDGAAMSTPLAYGNALVNSVLLDNADGFEFTRGARDSVIAGNVISLTKPLPVGGNAVEFATSGNGNLVVGNTFSKYVEPAMTVSGSNQIIRDNRFIDNAGLGIRANSPNLLLFGNTFVNNGGDAVTVNGAGSRVVDNVISGGRARAIVVASAGVTVVRNSIVNNAGLSVDAGTAQGGGGGGRGGGANTPPAPIVLPDAPAIDVSSRWDRTGMVVTGTATGKPNQPVMVQVYFTRRADLRTGADKGSGQGETYLKSVTVTTDATGRAAFSVTVPAADIGSGTQLRGALAATATDAAGTTSRFSRAQAITRR